jgi:Uma2 family endonuclease
MAHASPVVTAEEFERMPKGDYRWELVEGRLVRMSLVGYEHARVAMRFAAMLYAHAVRNGLGEVLPELGCKLQSNPDTVRGPDIAFIRRERTTLAARGFWNGAPDLVVEVLSPDDRLSHMRAKVDEYLSRGVLAVVIIDPGQKSVTIRRRLSVPLVMRGGDEIVLDDVLPGFICRACEIFE